MRRNNAFRNYNSTPASEATAEPTEVQTQQTQQRHIIHQHQQSLDTTIAACSGSTYLATTFAASISGSTELAVSSSNAQPAVQPMPQLIPGPPQSSSMFNQPSTQLHIVQSPPQGIRSQRRRSSTSPPASPSNPAVTDLPSPGSRPVAPAPPVLSSVHPQNQLRVGIESGKPRARPAAAKRLQAQHKRSPCPPDENVFSKLPCESTAAPRRLSIASSPFPQKWQRPVTGAHLQTLQSSNRSTAASIRRRRASSGVPKAPLRAEQHGNLSPP
ncbi:hypothetical protein MLD38_003855 [Melastoma candidum]|uniref:Uncharacterized protein n=1 Tax=Melastoma candidum TaxID=119954 RepID=A0ACB9S718_9MYRT|nr:hypothetical protein MLD38_003855 [Melastoma candidum]